MEKISVFLPNDQQSQQEGFRVTVRAVQQQVCTDPVTVEFREENRGDYYAFTFVSWPKEEYAAGAKDIVRSFVALIVVEWIVRTLEPELIQAILRRDFTLADASDWEVISPYVQFVLYGSEAEGPWESRRARIYKKVFEYLGENHEMVLQGFVRFRLKEELAALPDAVESGIDEYLRDQEYQQFVNLLRYFVSVQEPKYELVHIVFPKDQPGWIFDDQGQRLNLKQFDDLFGMADGLCREEDYWVSVLVSLAPKKIVFHLGDRKKALAETISGIFGERVTFCRTCAYCLTY
ncbi:sporulation protein YtxC [Brevibacillus sp. B_LB10_24]|uniref:sporulation protein YtxC n=1 Tax=Brevibacillus sp. B_LB10_24 TaxID=3380645 RepID=UPI0038BA425F